MEAHGTIQNYEEGIASVQGKYLTFWTDHQLFGVPIADVVQIVGMQDITAVPEFPVYAKGVINLRGNVIPLIDVRLRLAKAEIPYNERTCTIVINLRGKFSGLIVDEVDEVTDIGDDRISELPQMSADSTNAFLTGIGNLGKKVILLVDTEKMLGDEELEVLAQES